MTKRKQRVESIKLPGPLGHGSLDRLVRRWKRASLLYNRDCNMRILKHGYEDYQRQQLRTAAVNSFDALLTELSNVVASTDDLIHGKPPKTMRCTNPPSRPLFTTAVFTKPSKKLGRQS